MWTIILSLAAGVVVGGGLRVADVIHSTVASILPGLVATLIVLVLLFRRVSAQITPLMEEVQRHLQGGRQDMALATLRGGMRWSRWHPLLAPQLHTQIGALLYAQQDYDAALGELRQGGKSPWESRGFLACCYFKQRDDDGMMKAFEDARKAGEKDDLYWTVYAWCVNAQGKKDEAIKILKRGLEKLPGNQRLAGSIEALSEGKKIKVAPFGDRWARFGLDGSIATGGMKIPKAMRGFAQRPGFRQRPVKKR